MTCDSNIFTLLSWIESFHRNGLGEAKPSPGHRCPLNCHYLIYISECIQRTLHLFPNTLPNLARQIPAATSTAAHSTPINVCPELEYMYGMRRGTYSALTGQQSSYVYHKNLDRRTYQNAFRFNLGYMSLTAQYYRKEIAPCTLLVSVSTKQGARGVIVVKALRYKPAGREFDSRSCHWNFSVT